MACCRTDFYGIRGFREIVEGKGICIFLKEKKPMQMPNILGNRSFPVHTYCWKIIAKCEEREPLEEMILGMDLSKYRITSNSLQD